MRMWAAVSRDGLLHHATYGRMSPWMPGCSRYEGQRWSSTAEMAIGARLGGRMRRLACVVVCGLATGLVALTHAPVARADDAGTYEVISDDVEIANIEYQD